jgi:hypothetical protein
MKIMVFGSEHNVTADMLRTVRRLAERAREAGHTVMTFGADGVCAALIAACDELGVAIEVYGADHTFKRVTCTGANIAMPGGWQTRDEYMLRGFQLPRKPYVAGADVVICIWSGQKDETRYTMWRALCSEKPVWMYVRGAQRPRRCKAPAAGVSREPAAGEAVARDRERPTNTPVAGYRLSPAASNGRTS